MPTYAVHLMDQQGRRARVHELECGTDDEAMERLARMAHPGGIELWRGEELVWRFEARFSWQAGPDGAEHPSFRTRRGDSRAGPVRPRRQDPPATP